MLKKGDKIFYSDNGVGITDYSGVASHVIRDLGLIPMVYLGMDLGTKNSNLSKEIRDDVYQSKVVVLVLGKGEGWRSLADNWIMPELRHIISFGIRCFVYTLPTLTNEEINSLNLPADPIIAKNKDHFGTILKENLSSLLK